MPLEVELKFAADGTAPLEQLSTAPVLGPAILGPATRAEELDRYLDTAGGRLATARWACRLRTRGEATKVSLKGPAEAGSGTGALHRRPELEGPARATLDVAAWPPSAARDHLDALRAGDGLIERLALAQDRTERAVLIDGARIGTLSLDEVRVQRDGTTFGRLWIVELELLPGADETALGALAAALAAVDGLSADPMTKLERALEVVGA
jgi:inorganic triphosphatase YgiF